MAQLQAVGIMVPLEEGLSKKQIKELLAKLPDYDTIIPFEASANNSSVIGFMTTEYFDHHGDSIIATAKELCEDWDKERTDKTYPTDSGGNVFIDSKLETARGEKEIRSLSSWGEYVTVKTENQTYERVVLSPKPYTPSFHLLEASNGDVVEVKTVEIVAVNGITV